MVLHEVSHLLTPSHLEAAHGWRFARTYLLLVRRRLGVEAWRRLRSAFLEGGVRHRPPAKVRAIGPETRAALVARLAAWRAARAPIAQAAGQVGRP